jgi:hypothetical protein
MQKLWLAAQRREWRSLAVLGAAKTVDTLPIAELLAQLAWRYRGQPSTVCDLRDLSMRLVDYQVGEVHAQVQAGLRVLIALRSISENPTAAVVARESDAVVLCIAMGTTEFKAAQKAIAEIGRQRIVGSIIVRPRKRTGSPATNGQ